MHSKPEPAKRRFALHIHISLLFSLLLLGSGAILGIFNYQQTSKIILDSSSKLFEQMSNNVEADLKGTYQPIRFMLNLLARNEQLNRRDRHTRMVMLPLFVQALVDNPRLTSIYVGYPDGSFYMVRALRNQQTRDIFYAPPEAAYQIWSIDRISERRADSEFLYIDADMHPISRRQNLRDPYDPRTRPWYSNALQSDTHYTTAPYSFFSTKEIGTTIALANSNQVVVAADLTLADLSATLANHAITPSTEMVLYSPDGLAVAFPDISRLIKPGNEQQRTHISELSPVLNEFLKLNVDESTPVSSLMLNKERWQASYAKLTEGGPDGLRLLVMTPEKELLEDAYRIRWQSAALSLLILLLCIPLAWLLSHVLAKSLRILVGEAEAVRRFDFSYPASGRSFVKEVDQLAVSMKHMKETLSSFLDITASLSAETRFDSLLNRVLRETVGLSDASAGLIYLLNEGRLEPNGLFIDNEQHALDAQNLTSFDLNDSATPYILKHVATGGASITETLDHSQNKGFQSLLQTLDCNNVDLVCTGLHNRQGETLGVLLLLHRNDGKDDNLAMLRPERIAFVEAVSGVAALCIASQRLLEQQKQLLDAFIQLLAGAIDAKSPYTGGHCQRVPEITLLLARAAAESNDQAFRDYQPSAEDWDALHIAAWLHDCGKITTPEFVVDKATKLETLYDRLHEIRMRFEVLKRDAWIEYWQGIAKGSDPGSLAQIRDALLAVLDEEFAFVAQCNLGSEAMSDADLERLKQIGRRTWSRTLDNRIGLSWEENQRQSRTPVLSLPVQEMLLDDKPEHLFERPASEKMEANNPFGFKMEEPRYKYNRGELYNLSIRRGTLTDEERYIINGHMLQTIRMLKLLPFPPHLSNVAEIAGGHHEKMNGTGYPKKLKREEMSLPARMMAIADIFEALTAIDRPYKKGKRLSESLSIMADMCLNQHIDADLFKLFIQEQIYLQYATRFLQAQQIDAVDAKAILSKAGLN
ncbi:HD domain-containing phosphohydrolase [Ectopseudomonas mendocina]|uniref:HD domain-containing phosphohydrolase n=1 Tax=Ectopseudomonas mendocina TaxID=300 RepID=A0ABZ2RK36_ECTME